MTSTIASRLQSRLYAQGSRVIRAENCIEFCIRVIRRKDIIHAFLCFCFIPVRRCALLARILATADDELSLINVRLQDVHGAFEEEYYVVIIERSRRDFEVVRAFAFFQAEFLFNILPLNLADTVVIKRCIVVDSIRVHDQAIVRDDLAPSSFCFIENGREGTTIDSTDYDDLAALRDHVLDLRNLRLNLVLCELEIYIIAFCFKLGFHVSTILIPALQGLCRHRDAYLDAFVVTAARA